jgi:DNA-binding IclR family transcriptional regulator
MTGTVGSVPATISSQAPANDLRARQPKAIHSALTVLEEVARCGTGVTAREISDNLSLPRATAYRLLNLLVQDEYLVRMPDLRGFALGRKVVELARMVAPAKPPEAVRDVIDGLRERVRGGIHLVRYDTEGLRVIDADPDFPLSDEGVLQRQFDLSAMGQLLLAERHARAGASVTVSADIVRFGQIHDQGFARQQNAFSPGYGCLAVAIRDRSGLLVAGLCLSAPSARIENPADLLELLRRGAADLAPLLA